MLFGNFIEVYLIIIHFVYDSHFGVQTNKCGLKRVKLIGKSFADQWFAQLCQSAKTQRINQIVNIGERLDLVDQQLMQLKENKFNKSQSNAYLFDLRK